MFIITSTKNKSCFKKAIYKKAIYKKAIYKKAIYYLLKLKLVLTAALQKENKL